MSDNMINNPQVIELNLVIEKNDSKDLNKGIADSFLNMIIDKAESLNCSVSGKTTVTTWDDISGD